MKQKSAIEQKLDTNEPYRSQVEYPEKQSVSALRSAIVQKLAGSAPFRTAGEREDVKALIASSKSEMNSSNGYKNEDDIRLPKLPPFIFANELVRNSAIEYCAIC